LEGPLGPLRRRRLRSHRLVRDEHRPGETTGAGGARLAPDHLRALTGSEKHDPRRVGLAFPIDRGGLDDVLTDDEALLRESATDGLRDREPMIREALRPARDDLIFDVLSHILDDLADGLILPPLDPIDRVIDRLKVVLDGLLIVVALLLIARLLGLVRLLDFVPVLSRS